MSAELEQRRRNVQVCDLLTESVQALNRDDAAGAGAKYEAALEIDAQAVIVITGGMRIGEVPSPERDWPGWIEYVAAQREALAALEAEEGGAS